MPATGIPNPPALRTGTLALAALLAVSGCSLRTMAARSVADALAAGGDVWSRDDDPELIEDAVPFALKTYESLLETVPEHAPLLLATCRGFTQYAFAFVQLDAERFRVEDFPESRRLRDRSLRLYLRGRDYCLRAMAVRFGGRSGPIAAGEIDAILARAEPRDVPLLYWTAASWGSAVALAPDEPDLMIDFPVVRAFLERGLELDEPWNGGALHEAMITIESLQMLGGSRELAREHFERAVSLQEGRSPGPYVALATTVSVAEQDRDGFERLLERALAIDPDGDPSNRLATLVTQDRARWLLEHRDALFSR